MITVAEDILFDVEEEAMLLNGEVVRRAFEQSNAQPLYAELYLTGKRSFLACCRYEAHCSDFGTMLDAYLQAKRIAESARRRMLDPLTDYEKLHDSCPCWRIRQNRFAYAEECRQRKIELRARLREIWPCSACMERCNPTGRKRLWLM